MPQLIEKRIIHGRAISSRMKSPSPLRRRSSTFWQQRNSLGVAQVCDGPAFGVPMGFFSPREACLYSSVAQWQSIRLLTGGLLVRVQPEEPTRNGSIPET